MSRELESIEILVNGYLHRVEQYGGNVRFNQDTLQAHLTDAIQDLHDKFKSDDFGRNGGKRPDPCPVCNNETEEAGKKELPPYRDWTCTFCSMNGHDGRFNLKDR